MELIVFDTPFGSMGLQQEEGSLVRLYLPNAPVPSITRCETPLLKEGRAQLLAYLSGAHRAFELPLAPEGTPFQTAVWNALSTIPYGETRTYGALAAQIGKPNACRAVGGANNKNPLPIFIPCHRVVGASGALVGYAGGLAFKKALLALEQSR